MSRIGGASAEKAVAVLPVFVETTLGSFLCLGPSVVSCRGDYLRWLQMILIPTPPFLFKYLERDIKFDGFDIATCRETISLMDVSFTRHITFTFFQL